ncbi:ThuA domain-containing protein [Thalassoglobus sp. JC818]|uniref:ThuA domain-containing protein n=1 Tax=Thalassoglobus sp. JC818 TaxID=3232136 RepID=UPI00345A3668
MLRIFIAILSITLLTTEWLSVARAEETSHVLVVVGPSGHPPGSHEVLAGGRVVEACLENASNLEGMTVTVVDHWPNDEQRANADSVVFIGDTFPPNRFENPSQNLKDLAEMMDRGCGIVCLHYATGLLGLDVAKDGAHPLLNWMGGYFANRSCPHHESIARIFPEATIVPATPDHPVSQGWQPFKIHDEPYINNYFGPDGNRPAGNVTVFATSMLPPESPQREIVAWGVDRPDGGRGFGIVMPHFYKNWQHPDLRRFILNGIVWTAQRQVPENGVESELTDLEAYEPMSVEFSPR